MTAPVVRPSRPPRRRVDGVLLLDKPKGLSSNAVLQRAKRLFAAEKAGHTGTLDPLASGLLPLCFGDATKFAQAILDAAKEYMATVRFGIATSTGDAEGEIVGEKPVTFSRGDLEATLPAFTGRVVQIPPRHAALKYQGRNYYDYARAGIDIPRAPREVEVHALEVLDWALPIVALRVSCSKGTYVRVLAEDLGAALGTCAHLAGLRRTRAGPFVLERAVTLEALERMEAADRDALLLPVDSPLVELPRLAVDAGSARALIQGREPQAHPAARGRFRCYDDHGRFLGVVDAVRGLLRAVRLARTDTPPAR
jgi:tRNA pseudouridine55 synthase